MGIFISMIGGIVDVVCLTNGVLISPKSAPQQTVQELRFIEAALGAILFALGIVVHKIGVLDRAAAENSPVLATDKRPEVRATFEIGSAVRRTLHGAAGEVTAIDGEAVTVRWPDNRSSTHLSRDLKPL